MVQDILPSYQCKHTANFRSHLNPLHHSSGNREHLQNHESLSLCSMTHACISWHVLRVLPIAHTSPSTYSQGIQCRQALSHLPKPWLPITLQLLQNIYTYLSQQPHRYNNILMWAACCLAFFGFVRVSKFTTPSDTHYDKDCYLSIDDISIDSRDNAQLLKVTLKESKTDHFRVGVDLYLTATGGTICPVKALLPYLAMCGQYKGPLFNLEDGKYLTRQCLCTLLNGLLIELHIDTWKYNTHSFGIGATTTVRQANIPDLLIELMGKWKSNAYLTYIKTPPMEMANLSKHLIINYQPPYSIRQSST